MSREYEPTELTRDWLGEFPDGEYISTDPQGYLHRVRLLTLVSENARVNGNLVLEVHNPETGQWLEPPAKTADYLIKRIR